jgi:ubiquinol-cytochrome c reductase cytochrome c1 subunit
MSGMPHILWELQGERIAKFEEASGGHGGAGEAHFVGFEQVTPGKMSAQEYDSNIADLTAFLTWMSEPGQLERKRLGVIVLLFLAVFTVFAWRLNAAYWKSIH